MMILRGSTGTRTELKNQGRGVYTFKFKGTIHHRIGILLPLTQENPKFPQLDIYDNSNEFENRQLQGQHLSPSLMRNILSILHAHNPLIQQFDSLASDITPSCSISLTTKARNVDQRV